MRLLFDTDTNLMDKHQDIEFHEFDVKKILRDLIDNAASKLDMNIRKQNKITKAEDIGWIFYTNMFDVAIMLDMDNQSGELSDIVGRGASIEDIVCIPSGIFPSDCNIANCGEVKLGALHFINLDLKCPRCWKRYKIVDNETGLCDRCKNVVETHYYPETLP